MINWNKIQKAYNSSFIQDCSVQNWAGTGYDVEIHRCQEWNKGKFFLPPDMNIKNIFLDYSVISKGWCKAYGIPRLRDFVEPMDMKDIKKRIVSVGGEKPWRVFAGKDECQWMYHKIFEILDIIMRYVCSLYSRDCNEAFVLGDAGCQQNNLCSGHGGAHDNQHTIDLNYCTLQGFNMTHYRTSNMPGKYKGPNVNIWRDPFPQRSLKTNIFDTEKNYALYHLLRKIFLKGVFMTSVGLNNHFKKVYGNSVLRGDDIKQYNHFRHIHLCLYGEINWDAEIKLGD
ncbi:hypothetical protein KAW18_03695 [candidate division WOR-3 bacterium]|nr:hypothetical protein [Candidatus Parcubacteria bacterium]MCK4526450.1 hypothetical protein [candidate division WOR-3 bacterium]